MAIITGCWCTDLVVLFLAGFVAVYLYYQKKFKFWDNYKIPHTKPKFPFGDLGLTTFGENIVTTLDRIYKSYENERVVGIWTSFSPILIVKDLEIIKDILVKEFMSFHDRGIPVDEENDPLSAHLFSIGGSKWRNLRAKLSPTFTSGKMKLMFPILVECAREMVGILEQNAINKDVVEVKDILSRFTTDVISSCAFGIDTNSLKNPDAEFRKMGRNLTEPSFKNSLKQLLFFIPGLIKLLRIRTLPAKESDFFMNAVRETIEYREKNNKKRNDFMQLLITLKNKGKLDDVDENKGSEGDENKSVHKFTFEEAAAQAVLFFFAGFETSSTTMQFALYELALHPEIQEKLREEIKTVLAKHKGEVTYDAVFEMSYLVKVVDETLRKYPAAPVLIRKSNKDYKIPDSDMLIPKGTMIQVPVYSIHMDSRFFPDPQRFDPDRFKDEAKSERHRYAYLPFGEGPRNCIGMRFGLMQSYVGLVLLLLNYKFEVCEKSPIPLKFSQLSLSPKGGMHLRISKVK